MSQDVRPLAPPRPARLLPPAPGADRPLLFVIAIIVALAAASAMATRATFDAAAQWTADLAGSMTVQVRPGADGDPVAAAERAAALARDLPGVTSAEPVARAELERLLEPWFGRGGLPGDAPLLGLVDIHVDALTPPSAAGLESALSAAGLTVAVDDHTEWTRQVRDAANAMRLLAVGVLVTLVVGAVAVTSFATRASLAARRDVVEVLHMVGARDGFIADAFTRRFLGLGLRAGLLGAVFAGISAIGVQTIGAGASLAPAADFMPQLSVGRADMVILALTPLAAAGVAAATARETVLRVLKDVY